MRQVFVFGSLVALFLATPSLADEAALKALIQDYARAFNNKDLDSIAGFWNETGIHIDRETGQRTEGRDAIKTDIAASFQQNPEARLVGRIESLRFIKPDVASVEGEVTVSLPGEDPYRTLFSAIVVSQDGKWMIDTIEESPVPVPTSNYEALRELEWIIGRWVDDGGETRVDTEIRWSANEAFLLRSFAVTSADGVAREGTQVIGWDPRSGEVRSWTFQSDGSFGDATWSKSGDDWLVKSRQTLADGRAASGTFVYSPVNQNEITIRLIGHEIEGEPQPSSPSITIKRVVSAEPNEPPVTTSESSGATPDPPATAPSPNQQ